MLGRRRTRPDVAGGHDRLYLGIHVSNTTGRTCIMRLGSLCDSSQGDLSTIWHARMGRGTMTGRQCLPVAPVTDRVVTCVRFLCRLQDPPPEEKGGACSPKALFFSVFLFLLFLFLSLVYPRSFPWSIKGKARCPIYEDFQHS
jgi:hypothetical protein